MDPTPNIGQTPIESAIFNNIHIGGLTDSALALYPEFAITDGSVLEGRIAEILEGTVVQPDFYKRVEERHSFESFQQKIDKITGAI